MNEEEATRLIRLIETTHNRDAPAGAALAWAAVLKDVPYTWARDGALDLLREHPYWPTPADVYQRARKLADEEKARQNRDRQLALGAAVPPEPAPPSASGPALVRAMLAEVAARNKGVTDRASRRANARVVTAEFRDRFGAVPDRPAQSCGNLTCRCTHTEGCDAGWQEVDRGDGVMQAYPCRLCNPRRANILTSGSNRDAAMRALRDTSDVKAAEQQHGTGDAW